MLAQDLRNGLRGLDLFLTNLAHRADNSQDWEKKKKQTKQA